MSELGECHLHETTPKFESDVLNYLENIGLKFSDPREKEEAYTA